MVHVLHVEDNPTDVLLVRAAIRTGEIPADVTHVPDGEAAIRMLGQFEPDLIILDLDLPRCGGLELLEHHSSAMGPPVVVFTSSNDPKERSRAMSLGASDYIVKPIAWDDYAAAIRGAIERWGAPISIARGAG
jgi:CheY-like chemotaxis protein